MVNARRAARELALKVLFQLDVGKQPLDEVILGALDQVRHTIDHPVSQLAHELQGELKSLVDERRAEMSTQSLRQVRAVANSLHKEMNGLIEETSRRAAEMVAEPADVTVELVTGCVERDVGATVERMRRVAQRETPQPDLLRTLMDTAARRALQVPTAFSRSAAPAHATANFLHTLVKGALDRRMEIDQQVSGLSEGWALDRQPAVDRNILRIAAFEVMFLPDIPAGASINEAVELAKKFSTAESGRFVNGVLGALAVAVGKDEKVGSRKTENPAETTGGQE